MAPIHHALVLTLHQPSGNLEFLLDQRPDEALQILRAMGRLVGHLQRPSASPVHVSLSGTLLESLAGPAFQGRAAEGLDCAALLGGLRDNAAACVLASAYYHPVLPLIPAADREEQLARWLGIGRYLFAREGFGGFWPPELGFTMEMIPLLVRLGFRYVVVDSEHVEGVTPMSWESLRYRPHWAQYGDARIAVVVRDRELSDALEQGMDHAAFRREVGARTEWCDFEPLVTTATSGENGAWFRELTSGHNFWDAFLAETGYQADGIRPCLIEEYLDRNLPFGEVYVHTGARNIGWTHGHNFEQWTSAPAQRELLGRIAELSGRVHEGRGLAGQRHVEDPTLWGELEEAMWRVLRSETSCNLVWGEAGIDRAQTDLNEAGAHLGEALRRMG